MHAKLDQINTPQMNSAISFSASCGLRFGFGLGLASCYIIHIQYSKLHKIFSRQKTPNSVSKGLKSRGVEAEGLEILHNGLRREVMVMV